jgi:flagellar hook-associated protein 3 FlgL
MLVNNLLAELQRSLQGTAVRQEHIATGQRINRPSDDPAGVARVLSLKDAITDNSRFLKNIEDGQHWLTVTEAALSDSVEILAQVRNRVLQAQNDTLTAEERRSLSRWAADYLLQLVQVANRQEQGKYVFGGTEIGSAPYQLSDQVEEEAFVAHLDSPVLLDYTELAEGSVVVTDGSGTTFVEGVDYEVDYERGTITALATGAMSEGATYYASYRLLSALRVEENASGIAGDLNRQIGDGTVIAINIRGPEAYGASVNVFDVLRDVKNALLRNDHEGLQQGLAGLDAALDQVLSARTKVGAQYDHLAQAHDQLSEAAIVLQRLLSQIGDADIAEEVVKLQEQKNSYQAALGVTASISQLSLLNYLK